jgi:hypothetical protein
MKKTIRARCFSDDGKHKVSFDAVGWFEYATDDNIAFLADIGWGKESPAIEPVLHLYGSDKKMFAMMNYIGEHLKDEAKPKIGFGCVVNRKQALAWLKEHREYLLDEIRNKERKIKRKAKMAKERK